MKSYILIAFAAIGALACSAAREHEWPHLPEGTLPDTEVSTNVTLHVDVAKLVEFSLRIETADCSSNEVLVAIGHDADENGELSFDETAFVFGIDCGERYLASYTSGQLSYEVGSTLRIGQPDFDPSWNIARIIKRGEGNVDALVAESIETKRFSFKIR